MKSLRLLAVLGCLLVPAAGSANPYGDNVSIRLLPGWRQADGTYVAALEFELRAGWKTYWRAPGDAGVPPIFSWSGSQNVRDVEVIWPRPEVFWQNGMRSIGYKDRVVLPLRVAPGAAGPVRLEGAMQIGICSDICVPLDVQLPEMLLPDHGRPVPAIAAAMAERPFSGVEAGVGRVACSVEPAGRKVRLRAEIDLPSTGGEEVVVVETANPDIWVSEARSRREGNRLVAEVDLTDMSGGAMALDRSQVRLTVLGRDSAVDIEGCAGR